MQSPIPQLREKSHDNHPPFGGCESRLAGEALTQHGESMKQLLLPLAFGLFVLGGTDVLEAAAAPEGLRLNEILASNRTGVRD
ncbi:MAG: hypothetical protein EBU26_17155, partial [Verrucomicrobia bacterium]|nr:hypothetical protein [Verrucomicrobiota bacterium]